MAATVDAPNAPRTGPSRPSWKEGAIWMGAGAAALWGLWRRHRFAIEWCYAWEAAIDLAFACGNSTLGVIDRLVSSRRVQRVAVEPPLFILGHWRTGTTLLHEILNVDPRLRCPTTFECFVPHHFLLTQRWLTRWTGFAMPRTRSFDNVSLGWQHPQEDEFALLNLGMPSPYSRIAFPGQPPVDSDWLDLDALPEPDCQKWQATLLGFCRRLLAARPGRLVLKSPPHTCRIPTLVKLFPDARFVYLVRDPQDVIPSTLRLWRSLYSTYGYQRFDEAGLSDWVLDTFVHFHERFEATRALVPSSRLMVLSYEDLVAAPERQVRAVYETLDLGDYGPVADRVAAFCAAQRDYRPNRHHVDDTLRRAIEVRCQAYTTMYQTHRK